MKKQISDEQLEQVMRTLMADVAVGDDVIDEIADSPSIWWGVQRGIGQQESPAAMPWPPTPKWLRMLLIGVPATAAGLLLAFLLFDGSNNVSNNQAETRTAPVQVIADRSPVAADPANESVTKDDGQGLEPVTNRPTVVVAKPAKRNSVTSIKKDTSRPAVQKDEDTAIKSEFIALSYANNPESGQIVKVKVPSSMMVTLGLVSSVEKPSSLVDAEVVVGDDGLTHSIRFIRKSL